MTVIHPSKDIVGSKSRLLEGRRIALGVCGSVAALRAPEIAREMMRNGADVWAVISPAGQGIISPQIMEWATGNPVATGLTGKIEHVALGGDMEGSADLVLIAPATANTIGKIAAGIDDTAVTSLATTAIGAGKPMIIAPAMHGSMYSHPAVAENLERLRKMGIRIVDPVLEEGKAKIADCATLVREVIGMLCSKDLAGKRVLITAGPTRSYLDAIRYLTNSSSGRMGLALAEEASARGAEVTVVCGPSGIRPPGKVIRVETTEEMLSAVLAEIGKARCDLLILAAAPLDFAFSARSAGKITSESELAVSLVPLPKIYEEARKASSDLFIIGFKAEYGLEEGELLSRAQRRLEGSGMNLIVANDLSRPDRGFEAETNEVYILGRTGLVSHIPLSSKREVARAVLDAYIREGTGSAG